jgi:AmpD protein
MMKISRRGRAQGVCYIASPNWDERPSQCQVELLVIHSISLPPGEFGGTAIIDLFTNRLDPEPHPFFWTIKDLKVSCHFLIRRDGKLIQFVPCTKRAWHAGVSAWRGRSCCNDFSIGIELEGSDTSVFTEIQYRILARLTAILQRHYPIKDIVGHADIAPGRKTDPGPQFDWPRYRRSTASLTD